jgi:hypothetical protein
MNGRRSVLVSMQMKTSRVVSSLHFLSAVAGENCWVAAARGNCWAGVRAKCQCLHSGVSMDRVSLGSASKLSDVTSCCSSTIYSSSIVSSFSYGFQMPAFVAFY